MKRSALLLLCLLPAGGCSAYMANSGTDFSELWTAERVRAELGEPDFQADGLPDGGSYEQYTTHRIIRRDPSRMPHGLEYGLTLGTIELVYFPREVVRWGGHLLFGQTVHFRYDKHGRIIQLDINHNWGDGSWWGPGSYQVVSPPDEERTNQRD